MQKCMNICDILFWWVLILVLVCVSVCNSSFFGEKKKTTKNFSLPFGLVLLVCLCENKAYKKENRKKGTHVPDSCFIGKTPPIIKPAKHKCVSCINIYKLSEHTSLQWCPTTTLTRICECMHVGAELHAFPLGPFKLCCTFCLIFVFVCLSLIFLLYFQSDPRIKKRKILDVFRFLFFFSFFYVGFLFVSY